MTTPAGTAGGGRTVAIVGVGRVGASAAMSVLHMGIATRLLLHDIDAALAEGEAMDLAHGAPYYRSCDVRSVSLDQARDADVIVVTAGHVGPVGTSRLDLVQPNADVVRGVAAGLSGFDGVVIVVTNPVDVMTQLVASASGLPPARVIGTGTLLDSARLGHELASELSCDVHDVDASVIGEHGDSQVVLWSAARIGGGMLRARARWSAGRERRVAERVRRAAHEVRTRTRRARSVGRGAPTGRRRPVSLAARYNRRPSAPVAVGSGSAVTRPGRAGSSTRRGGV